MPPAPTFPPILDDLPADADSLGFEPYVLALSDILLDPNTHSPLTLGLFGSWGSGKTSLMRMMRRRIEERPLEVREAFPMQTVWFNAWMYSREESLWRALLLHVLRSIRPFLAGYPEANRALDRIAAQLTTAAELASPPHLSLPGELVHMPGVRIDLPLLTGLHVLQATPVNSPSEGAEVGSLPRPREVEEGEPSLARIVDIVETALARARQDRIAALDDFRRTLETVSRSYVRDRGRLVVFVDDLDRCLPEKAIEVLEALKLFLDVEGWVFVLALDAEAIENAIRHRYQGDVKAREYLEKIVQVPFILPPIDPEPMRAYVQALAPALPDPRCAEVFAVGLGSNPRQVKRILNIFLLLSRLVERRPALREAITPTRLAKIVAIQHAHPDLYALVRLYPGYLRDLEGYFRAGSKGGRPGVEGAETPKLPEVLQPFSARSELQRLLLCLDDEDARFDVLTPQDLRSYVTLTRQAAPVETPAGRMTRRPFEPELVPVPAGPFLMGTSPQQVEAMLKRYDWAEELKDSGWFDDEQPQHEVTLAAFEIGRYPVSNAEYTAFVEATGGKAPPHWEDSRLPEDLADHPVVNMTWRDALAYVQWLAERTEQLYRLPTEAEWEKAARGEDGRLWPWGNDWDPARANCKPAGTGQTTPRGQYSPGGDSPYGAADMAGNVWEWCSSLWVDDSGKPLKYPYRADDGRENLEAGGPRILRGGSCYDDNPGIVRCAYRLRNRPDFRVATLGFRVARGPLK